MKFTSKGGVTINVKSLETLEGKANIQFQVCDTGIGIDNDRLERIFERFKQASAETSRYYGGTGLGLAISKQLVELQEGSMVVSQNPGGGSIFTFVIPFMIMDEQAILEQQKHIVPKQEIFYETFRMLVADDNPFNQLIVKKMMQKHYFNAIVEAVDNGKAAMSMISRFKYDVLLLDVKMPEMEGPEVAAIVKQMDEYKHIPIVAFTAGVTDEERKRCKNAGMDYFLPKPFSKEELFQVFVDTGIVKAEEKT
jgi:CheY-like chemotaxis protein